MKASLHLGKIAGIKVSIHWTFLILLGWVFYSAFTETRQIGSGLWSVLYILALFLCVVLHEFGHALMAKRFGIKTDSIILLPIGGVATIQKMPEKPSQELAVALAGPLVNVVIAAILYPVLLATGKIVELNQLTGAVSGNTFFMQLLVSNVALVLFNLLPAFPMDGGRVLRAILAFFYERTHATRIAARIGQVIAVLFMWFGFMYNFWLIIIGLFIFSGAGLEYRYESASSLLKSLKVKQATMHKYTLLQTGDTIGHAADVLLNGQEKSFLVFSGEELFGTLSRNDIIRGLKEYGSEAQLSGIAQQQYLVAEADEDLESCYAKMTSAHVEICPVVAGEKLLGVIDSENISELLLLKSAEREGPDHIHVATSPKVQTA